MRVCGAGVGGACSGVHLGLAQAEWVGVHLVRAWLKRQAVGLWWYGRGATEVRGRRPTIPNGGGVDGTIQ